MDFNVAWGRIKKWAGACSQNADLEDLKAAVQTASGRIDKVLFSGQLIQGNSGTFEKLNKANEGLTAIGESLEKVQDVCIDITALAKIHDAIITLSDDQVIYKDPQAAADAFDTLFQGFGRLCRYLPSPAKEWGQFFEQFNLFGNVQKNIYAPYFERLHNAHKYN